MSEPEIPQWQGKPVVCFHTMAKPSGSACNLNCRYCFYLGKRDLLGQRGAPRMSDEVLEAFIRQYIEGQNAEEVVFSWQGGEPTLLGLDFFRKALALEEKYRRPGMRCENDLQTNCTLLDEEWCEFLAQHRFLVGVSIDGPQRLHDAYRQDRHEAGSFDRVMAAVKLLRKHGVTFNTLTCVHRENARWPRDVYRFLRDEVGSARMQFIPIVEPKAFGRIAPQRWDPDGLPALDSPAARPGTPESFVHEWCVDPDDYGTFLCKVFEEWHRRDIGRTWVYFFEAAVAQWMGQFSPLCVFAPVCGKGVALECDGTLYSCDHYVYPEHRLGNILETPLDKLVFSPRQAGFGEAKHKTLPRYCRDCEYGWACLGECPKNRFLRTPDGEPGLNYLCRGLKKYFRHIDPFVRNLARQISQGKG